MFEFTYSANPARVIFGSGTLGRLPEIVEEMGLQRVVVLSTPQQKDDAERLQAVIGKRCAGIFPDAQMHTPVHVTEKAVDMVLALQADGLVAVGGGSTTGLGKAIALRTDLVQIVAPTTYAGSEMTPILGETRDGNKMTQTNAKVLPEVVIYDVDLTMSLPVKLSGTSGINAIAHAIEALYSRDANPVISLLAKEAVSEFSKALPAISANPGDRTARSGALYGAWLCGTCLGAVGMALHHKLCHTLGGMFDLPHAETHTVILPHALAYNAPAVPEAMRALREALDTNDPPRALYDLAGKVGAPRSLKELGMPESGIAQAVERAIANPYWNPRELEPDLILALIENAFAGRLPEYQHTEHHG